MSPTARAAMITGIVVAVLALAILALKGSSPKEDTCRIKWRNAQDLVEHRGSDEWPEALRLLREAKTLATQNDHPECKSAIRRIEDEIKKRKSVLAKADKKKDADRDWREINRTRLYSPKSVDKIRGLCDAYLKKYAGLGTPHEKDVREVLAQLDDVKVSPQEKKLADVLDRADDLLRKKEFRKAWEAIQNADPEIRELYAEELDKRATWIRKRSRQVLTVRKNDIRHELRLGNRQRAMELLDDLFDKLVLSTIEDYLEAPDKGYRNPKTAKLELQTQALMKQKLAEVKRARGLR